MLISTPPQKHVPRYVVSPMTSPYFLSKLEHSSVRNALEDDLEVLARYGERLAFAAIVCLEQLRDVIRQRSLTGGIESRERFIRRAVVAAEDIDEMRRRLVSKHEVLALGLDELHTPRKQLGDAGSRTPTQRAGNPGRRWNVAPDCA